MRVEDGELRIRPVQVADRAQESAWLRGLYEHFAPVRDEVVQRGIGQEELDADIDAAVRAVREGHA